jgi:hypothetical protein
MARRTANSVQVTRPVNVGGRSQSQLRPTPPSDSWPAHWAMSLHQTPETPTVHLGQPTTSFQMNLKSMDRNRLGGPVSPGRAT